MKKHKEQFLKTQSDQIIKLEKRITALKNINGKICKHKQDKVEEMKSYVDKYKKQKQINLADK